MQKEGLVMIKSSNSKMQAQTGYGCIEIVKEKLESLELVSTW